MQKAKIFALTSFTECFPMVLLEAKATGMANVSYDCLHGLKNIINDSEDGLLSKPNDIVEFANKLELFINDEELINRFSINFKSNIFEFSKEKKYEYLD